MKSVIVALIVAVSGLVGESAFAAERTVTLAVDNMTCEACPYIVKQSLAAVPGVETVNVSLEQKTATVTYDDAQTSVDALTAATTQSGFPSRAVQ